MQRVMTVWPLAALLLLSAGACAQESEPQAAPANASEPARVGDIWKPTREGVSAEMSAEVKSKAAAIEGDAPGVMIDGMMTDREGRTLYRFDRDRRNASTCQRICAQLWPPFAARASDEPRGEFTIVERFDGVLQWAFRGHPLYYWVHDTKPGDVTGDDVNEVWHVIREGLPAKR